MPDWGVGLLSVVFGWGMTVTCGSGEGYSWVQQRQHAIEPSHRIYYH
jgi:hypothetical protein